MKSHIANSSQAAALVAAILTGNANLLGAALGERVNSNLFLAMSVVLYSMECLSSRIAMCPFIGSGHTK